MRPYARARLSRGTGPFVAFPLFPATGLDFLPSKVYLTSSLVEISSCAQGLKSAREKCSRGASRCAGLAHVGAIPLKPGRRFPRRLFSFRGWKFDFPFFRCKLYGPFENAPIPQEVKGYADGDSLRQLFFLRAFYRHWVTHSRTRTRTHAKPPTTAKTTELKIP